MEARAVARVSHRRLNGAFTRAPRLRRSRHDGGHGDQAVTVTAVLPASHSKAVRVAQRLAPGVRAASESGRGRASDRGSSRRDMATPAGAAGAA